MSDLAIGLGAPQSPGLGGVPQSQLPGGTGELEKAGSTPFDKLVDGMTGQVDKVNDALQASDMKTEAFLKGEETSIHEVMIAMTKADISFRLMTQVGRKVIEAYQEISRMQV